MKKIKFLLLATARKQQKIYLDELISKGRVSYE